MGSSKYVTRKPFSTAVRSHLIFALGIFSMTALAEDPQQANGKWACRANAEGQWVCSNFSVPGPVYGRPEHRETTILGNPEEPRINLTRNLDWVPEEQLSEAEKTLMRESCCGAYVEPPREYPDSDMEPEKASIRVAATTTEARGNVAVLEGDVQVSQGYRQVRSNRAVVDQDARTVDLEGNINFREPGMLLTGEKAHINMDSGEIDIADARFVLHNSGVRGSAGQLTRDQDQIIYIDNATYTTCEPGNNAWQLRSSDVAVDRARNHVTAKNVRLKVKDVPVLYIPWIRFPASSDRASGLLFPHISSGNDNGIDFAQPLYLNLAPNYDATFTPRYIQERGAMLEGEFRHLATWGATSVSGAFLGDDDGGDIERDAPNTPLPYEGKDRWVVNLDHQGRPLQGWSTRIDYTDVSDVDYFEDLDTATLEVNSRSHLNQQASLGYRTARWDFGIQAQQFETIIENGQEQFKQLPKIHANGLYRHNPTDLVLSLKQHAVLFDHSEDNVVGSGVYLTRDTENTTVTGTRLRADYGLTWDKQWLWGFFRPGMMMKYITYNLDNPLLNQTDDNPDAAVPVGTLDTGLYFERDTNWLSGYVQTLEPRIYYLHSAYDDQSAIPNFDTKELTFSYQQLFRDDRFSGGDRIGDTEQVTVGVTSRLIDAQSGKERLRGSIGQIFYLKDRQVSLAPLQTNLLDDESNIATEFSALLTDNWRLQGDLLLDDDAGNIEKGSTSLRYNNREDTLFNFAYRFTRRDNVLQPDIDQMDLSMALPLATNWKFLARYNQDLNANEELEVLAGLQYSSCCWRATVLARRWIDRDDDILITQLDQLEHQSGIFFQIQFKGLAGTGTRVNNILQDGIYGYQPPEI